MNERLEIFISYKRGEGDDVVREIQNYLTRKKNYFVFRDVDKIEGGEDWSEKITKFIKKSDIFILILTPLTLSSGEVEKEVREAKKWKKRILPCKHQSVMMDELKKWDLTKLNVIEYSEKNISALLLSIDNSINTFLSEKRKQLVKKGISISLPIAILVVAFFAFQLYNLFIPPINHLPVTENSFIRIPNTAGNDIDLPLNISDEDINDKLMITPIEKPRHGIITKVNPSNKTISISSEKGFSGIDSVNFFVKDDKNEKSNTSTITYMINCPWTFDTKNLKKAFDTNADIGYRLYSDNDLDIKFYYPIEWIVSKSLKQEDELKPYNLAYTLNPINVNSDIFNPSLQILVAPLSGNSFKTILENASASNFDQNYETPEFTGIFFNDRCASEETIENTNEQYGKVKAYSIKIIIDDVLYNFLYWAQIDQFDKYLPKILKIIGSIEVV